MGGTTGARATAVGDAERPASSRARAGRFRPRARRLTYAAREAAAPALAAFAGGERAGSTSAAARVVILLLVIIIVILV